MHDHGSHRRPHERAARKHGLTALALGLTGAIFLLASCDSTAKIFPRKVFFDRAMIVSANPATKDSQGNWVRQCDPGPAEGIIANVAFISTQRNDETDRDLGIRPGDVIDSRVIQGGLPDDINLTNEGNLSLSVDCIDPQPHPNPSGPACQGATPSFNLEQVRYAANNASRTAGHNILILIDESGSISGIVDPARDNLEARPDSFPVPGNFGQLGSDRANLRIATVKRLIRNLNPDRDRFGVLAFSETFSSQMRVPCTESQGDLRGDLDACFGARNTDIWTAQAGLDSLNDAAGRSPLWRAVDFAYSYLREKDDRTRGNHIIVLTDGPDTCSVSEAMTPCESACSTTGVEDVLNKIKADQANPNAPAIRVHFVQFESIGYPGRDPRQVEVSCVSGGHYQHINSNAFPRAQTGPFEDALSTAILNIRYMLSGHWELASGVPAYASPAAPPTGTRPGSLYALNGLLTVGRSTRMVGADTPFPFGIGQGAQADQAPNWDRRPVLRKPCTTDAECGASGTAEGCTIICSSETFTCPGGATGITAPDTFPCTPSAGGSGFCCEGECLGAGGLCPACN